MSGCQALKKYIALIITIMSNEHTLTRAVWGGATPWPCFANKAMDIKSKSSAFIGTPCTYPSRYDTCFTGIHPITWSHIFIEHHIAAAC